jgi:hypothetical protein
MLFLPGGLNILVLTLSLQPFDRYRTRFDFGLLLGLLCWLNAPTMLASML